MINTSRNRGGNVGGFQGGGQGRYQSRVGGNFSRGNGGSFGRTGQGAASWEDRRVGVSFGRTPDLGSRSGPDILKKRQGQVLLAVILNHPDLLEMFAEDIAMVSVSNPKLDKLRQEILKVYALTENLDSEGLKTQLTSQGNSVILKSVLTSDVYVHAGFAKQDATEDSVRAGFLQVLASHLAPARRAELEDARRLYVNEPTDENWERFEKLKMDGPGSSGKEAPAG